MWKQLKRTYVNDLCVGMNTLKPATCGKISKVDYPGEKITITWDNGQKEEYIVEHTENVFVED